MQRLGGGPNPPSKIVARRPRVIPQTLPDKAPPTKGVTQSTLTKSFQLQLNVMRKQALAANEDLQMKDDEMENISPADRTTKQMSTMSTQCSDAVPTISSVLLKRRSSVRRQSQQSSSTLSADHKWAEQSAHTRMNTFVTLDCDREVLRTMSATSCLRFDSAAYGQDWMLYHRTREDMFQPWQFTTSGQIEKHRLQVISMYWLSIKKYSVSPATVFVAVNNFGRLLSTWSPSEFAKLSKGKWAQTAMVAYRLAFKLEERPEVLWEINNFWNVFPAFDSWEFDRSEETLNKIEIEALHHLKDSMDIPLAALFLSLYLCAGGWPQEVSKEYRDLALYLLALATFTSSKDYLLHRVTPSTLAAAALVLAVKIINGDRCSTSGMLKHLPSCKLSTPQRGDVTLPDFVANQHINMKDTCMCRFEYFPERLRVYTFMEQEEVQPAIRGLSYLLRGRCPESAVLREFFPTWGDNDWQ